MPYDATSVTASAVRARRGRRLSCEVTYEGRPDPAQSVEPFQESWRRYACNRPLLFSRVKSQRVKTVAFYYEKRFCGPGILSPGRDEIGIITFGEELQSIVKGGVK